MKSANLGTPVAVLTLICLSAGAEVFLRANIVGDKPKPHEIEGLWTQICWEHQAKVVTKDPRLWTITKDKITKVATDKSFPPEQWSFKLDVDGKPGTIDGVLLDKDGKESPTSKLKGIYNIKEDFMLVCFELDQKMPRPDKFTTSGASSGTFLFLLRRGKVK